MFVKLMSKVFSLVGNLKNHFHTYTREKSHVCEVLNRGFSNKNDLRFLIPTGENLLFVNYTTKNFQKMYIKSHIQAQTCEKP